MIEKKQETMAKTDGGGGHFGDSEERRALGFFSPTPRQWKEGKTRQRGMSERGT